MTYWWVLRRMAVRLGMALACMLLGMFAGYGRMTWLWVLACTVVLLGWVAVGVGLGWLRTKVRRRPPKRSVLQTAFVDDHGDLKWRNADEAELDTG